jgi:lysophospholipase L1-like esterase
VARSQQRATRSTRSGASYRTGLAPGAARHYLADVHAQAPRPLAPARRRPLAVAVALAVLAACGGSSDESPAPSPSPSPTPPARIDYVALGDSTGFGVGALPGDGGYPPRLARRLREAGREVDLLNLSVPGARASDLAGSQLAAVAATSPTLVTVCVGANDAGEARAPGEFGAEMEEIFTELARLRAAVVACNVPDVSLTPRYRDDPARAAEVAADVVALNAELAAAAARHGVPVADIYRVSREQLFENPDLISPDGFHPSAAGYEVWAEAMLPTVNAALAIP